MSALRPCEARLSAWGKEVSLTACASAGQSEPFHRPAQGAATDNEHEGGRAAEGGGCSLGGANYLAHGQCFSNAYFCDADFVGGGCEVDLRAYYRPTQEHLPAHDPGMDHRTCVRSQRWTTEGGAVLGEVV